MIDPHEAQDSVPRLKLNEHTLMGTVRMKNSNMEETKIKRLMRPKVIYTTKSNRRR